MEPGVKGERRRCDQTGKVCFDGVHDARRAHRHTGFRVRVYRCDDCRQFHVTNSEKFVSGRRD